jgi:hypothetical protein
MHPAIKKKRNLKIHLLVGLTGIEPVTVRYERNILPLNYRGPPPKRKNETYKNTTRKKQKISISKLNRYRFKFLTYLVIIFNLFYKI